MAALRQRRSTQRRLKSQAARACHFEPATMRRVDRPHENAIATSTHQNGSHGFRVETQGAYGAGRAAGPAFDLRGGYFKDEDLLKKTCRGIAVQDEV
jgi:hypothetical protein